MSSYEATFGALDRAMRELDEPFMLAEHLDEVLGTPEHRRAYEALSLERTARLASLADAPSLRRFASSDEARALDPIRTRFIVRTLAELRLAGAELDAHDRAQLIAIDRALEEETLAFETTARTSSGAEHVLRRSEDRDQRRAAYLARGADNGPRATRILTLRAERARLLGFASFADLVTSTRMMKTAGRALDFVETLAERLEPAFRRETESLVAFARAAGAPPLEAWDVAYWSDRQRHASVASITLDHALDVLLGLVEELFGIAIGPRPDAGTWHPDVIVRELRDGERVLGVAYFDLLARPGKREGSWLTPLAPGVGVVVTDFAARDLAHADVVMLFHEVGHLLHHLFSDVPVSGLAGTKVAWDFVEVPSMIFERLAWEPAVLARLGMTAAPAARDVSTLVWRLGVAALDLRLHSGESVDAHALLGRFSPAPLPREHAIVASLAPLFSSTRGYEASFYAYPWAEVLAADAMESVRTKGAAALRREILSRGDSEEPATLFRNLVGRDPTTEALLARLGVAR